MSQFKIGDRVIFIDKPEKIWTIVDMNYDSKAFPIELDSGVLPTGICAEHEIRHLTPLEELL